MAETLKFGPEWLRALSDGNSVTSPPPSPAGVSKYKLADYRYGREEMLALLNPDNHKKVPESLRQFPAIVVENVPEPMAYIPLTDEEQKMMTQSVNSAAVLRIMGRGAPPIRGGGRGAPVERGRGRGRGRGIEGGYYGRGTSMDEVGDGSFSRGRTFMRSESWEEGREKRFPERTFPPSRSVTSSTDDDLVSPRRTDFSRSTSVQDNWRDRSFEKEIVVKSTDKDPDDDGGDWRRAGPSRSHDKWGNQGGSSWREQRGRGGEGAYNRGYNEDGGRGSYSRHGRSSNSWEEEDMPDWAMPDADDDEDIGTFDSSGAFMSKKDAKAIALEEEKNGDGDHDRGEVKSNGAINKSSKSLSDQPSDIKATKPLSKDKNNRTTKSTSELSENVDTPQKTVDNKEQITDTNSTNNNNKTAKKLGRTKRDASKSDVDTTSNGKMTNAQQKQPSHDVASQLNNENVKSKTKESKDVVETRKQSQTSPNEELIARQQSSSPQQPVPIQTPPAESVQLEEPAFDHLEAAAESLLDTFTAEEEKNDGALPWDHVNAKKWFYRDPQGEVQGPFSNTEMAEWFSAGYFTMNLLVKRGCDVHFRPLGEMIKQWGRVPFLPEPTNPPPNSAPSPTIPVTTDTSNKPMLTAAAIAATQQQQMMAQLNQLPEQLRPYYQQIVMEQALQQQAYIRQLQIIQQQPGTPAEKMAAVATQQQQQLMVQMMMKQKLDQLLQQPQQQAAAQTPSTVSPQIPPHQQQPSHQQQSQILPVSTAAGVTPVSNSQPPVNDLLQSFWNQASTASPGMWPGGVAPGGPGGSIWDLDPTKVQTLKEVERLQRDKADKGSDGAVRQRQQIELEIQQRQQQQQEEELRRKKEEDDKREQLKRMEEERLIQQQQQRQLQQEEDARRKREDDERKRQEEEKIQRELERQRDLDREREIDRQREVERQREIQRQKQIEIEKRELAKQQEIERLKEIEQQKAAEMELQRQEEIRRRQEMQRQQEVMRRQQQQQQLARIQLPSSAQWANQTQTSSSPSPSSVSSSLAQIQAAEEKERLEREERNRIEMQQRQQMHAIHQQLQQQQQQQSKTWGPASPVAVSNNGAKSLMEIQQEQAKQLEKERDRQMKQQQHTRAAMSLASVTAWGSSANAATWAQEGAWGNAAKSQNLGFWDEAVNTVNKKNSSKMTGEFPSLGKSSKASNASNTVHTTNQSNKKSKASKKEEEAVQKLFKASTQKPKDEFHQWCENMLHSMQTSVDVPTFIVFLMEVDSPYEVHDYVRSYLGETKEANNFAKQFLERRSKHRNHAKVSKEDAMWGPAPAVTPRELRNNDNNDKAKAIESANAAAIAAGKKKKKMQKVDKSFLGFTVHAAPDRVNVGEIETTE